MSEEVWRPLGFDGEDAATYDALHDGVPAWMAESFWEWMRRQFVIPAQRAAGTYRAARFRSSLLLDVERVCRLRVGYTGSQPAEGMRYLRAILSKSGTELRVADYLLSRGDATASDALDNLLHESGSAWKVGTRSGRMGLDRRVPLGVQTNADSVMASSGSAGVKLAQAWERAFGISPDPIGAYALAVRAVEDAAIPVVVPKQKDPSLGHVVGQLERDGDWSLPFNLQDDRARTADVVTAMCRALFKGHDHHGGSDTPGQVTQDEAEAAVTLAVPLVQWFASGMVAQR